MDNSSLPTNVTGCFSKVSAKSERSIKFIGMEGEIFLLINQTDYLQIDTFKKSDDSDDSRAHFKYYVQRKKKSKKRINDFLLA